MTHLAYSRDHEREADRYAVALLRRSSIDPRRFAALLERMEEQRVDSDLPFMSTFFSSHPDIAERASSAQGDGT